VLLGCGLIALSVYLSFGVPNQKFARAPAPAAKNDAAESPSVAGAGTKQIDTKGMPSLGADGAPVIVVEFADFQCPFCGKFYQNTSGALKTNYIDTGKVKYYFAGLSFLGQESVDAFAGAMCAGEQGKYWDYSGYLFLHQNGENQGAFKPDRLKEFAAVLGLDAEKFGACVDSKKYEAVATAQTKVAQADGIDRTPYFFINGKPVIGAVPTADFFAAIDSVLKQK